MTDPATDEDRMPHGGTVWATLACTFLLLALGVYAPLQQTATASARTDLRNPATGERAVCAARFAPAAMGGGDPVHAVAACERACENKGLVRTGGQSADIDFVSRDAMLRYLKRWRDFIPPACR